MWPCEAFCGPPHPFKSIFVGLEPIYLDVPSKEGNKGKFLGFDQKGLKGLNAVSQFVSYVYVRQTENSKGNDYLALFDVFS